VGISFRDVFGPLSLLILSFSYFVFFFSRYSPEREIVDEDFCSFSAIHRKPSPSSWPPAAPAFPHTDTPGAKTLQQRSVEAPQAHLFLQLLSTVLVLEVRQSGPMLLRRSPVCYPWGLFPSNSFFLPYSFSSILRASNTPVFDLYATLPRTLQALTTSGNGGRVALTPLRTADS